MFTVDRGVTERRLRHGVAVWRHKLGDQTGLLWRAVEPLYLNDLNIDFREKLVCAGQRVVFTVLDVDLHVHSPTSEQRAEVVQADGPNWHRRPPRVDMLVDFAGV